MTLGEVGRRLGLVLDKVDQAITAASNAADLARDAGDLVGLAGAGTRQGDVEQARATFTEVVEAITEAEGLTSRLAHAADLVRSYATTQGLTAPAPTPEPPTRAPQPGSPEHIDRLRRELPPQVVPRSGAKTHGRWFAADQPEQVGSIVSGGDQWSVEATRQAAEQNKGDIPTAVVDVEVKLATLMAVRGITAATLVINHAVCKGRYGCDTLVPRILPEGSTLTIHSLTSQGTIVRKTYTGGASWS